MRLTCGRQRPAQGSLATHSSGHTKSIQISNCFWGLYVHVMVPRFGIVIFLREEGPEWKTQWYLMPVSMKACSEPVQGAAIRTVTRLFLKFFANYKLLRVIFNDL